jgi:predicted trehalose synthase
LKAKPLSERRLKRSPTEDVAGMIRSFHYAAFTTLRQQGTFAGYEVAYKLNHRPSWVGVPSRGILSLLTDSGENSVGY